MSRSSLVFQSISALHQEAESAHLKLVHSDKNMKEVLEPFDDEELDEAASVMGAEKRLSKHRNLCRNCQIHLIFLLALRA